MIVTTADLAGFPHRSLATLAAILRYAGGDTGLGPYARLIPTSERPAVRRAAIVLELAEELHRRIPRDEAAVVRCRRGRRRDWPGLRSVVAGNHLIFYVVGRDAITVEHVIDGRMDIDEEFRR